jgi:hypothetical protein
MPGDWPPEPIRHARGLEAPTIKQQAKRQELTKKLPRHLTDESLEVGLLGLHRQDDAFGRLLFRSQLLGVLLLQGRDLFPQSRGGPTRGIPRISCGLQLHLVLGDDIFQFPALLLQDLRQFRHLRFRPFPGLFGLLRPELGFAVEGFLDKPFPCLGKSLRLRLCYKKKRAVRTEVQSRPARLREEGERA